METSNKEGLLYTNMGSSRKTTRALKYVGLLGVGCLAYLMATCAFGEKPNHSNIGRTFASITPMAP